jgi:oxysterol-binding protein-related protein 3/6/7
MYVEHTGIMTVKNLKSGDYCEVEFKKRGWSGKNAFEVDGWCYSRFKEKKYRIFGKWTESISIKNCETGHEETLWIANPLPADSDKMYNFTLFALQLNHLPPGLMEKLPPTDSRLRPD